MKCYHCHRNALRMLDEIALCSSCYTDQQNICNNRVSSAFQLYRANAVAESMLKAKDDLLRKQHAEQQTKNERNTEVNNYMHVFPIHVMTKLTI